MAFFIVDQSDFEPMITPTNALINYSKEEKIKLYQNNILIALETELPDTLI